MLRQSNQNSDAQWVVNSFEVTVGIIGGYTGLVWAIIMFSIGGYQSFKMDASYAKTLFTRQEKQPKRARSEEEMLDDGYLLDSINGRVHYSYTYVENWLTWFLTTFLCCFSKLACYKNRLTRYEVHQSSKERLSAETDIVQIIEQSRITHFLAKIGLKRHQRKLIPSFRLYNLDDDYLLEPPNSK